LAAALANSRTRWGSAGPAAARKAECWGEASRCAIREEGRSSDTKEGGSVAVMRCRSAGRAGGSSRASSLCGRMVEISFLTVPVVSSLWSVSVGSEAAAGGLALPRTSAPARRRAQARR